MPGPYSYFFIEPAQINILEGFTTQFKVQGIPLTDPGKPENVTPLLDFHVEGEPDVIEIVKQANPSFVAVKGARPSTAPVKLVARPKEAGGPLPAIEAKSTITVDESDILIYAPDGYVYWVKTETWMKAERFTPDSKSLNDALIPLLKNETVVANIPPNPFPDQGKASPKRPQNSVPGPMAEPITCFLLNLNSILFSYSPRSGLEHGHQGPTPPGPNGES
ncbi:hypothetical protein LY474_06635 [Myxococcus stipitatus]|uniref:hypothetical protein n=1 Tax=Myxococcus stipitatus TaxID=83455 RepID=UPI001F3D9F1B|nr:hypothetical protein [Myxococcus stipitatus]MCE9667488.1 hypothetical protein [Myxococcus stipitatus]